MMLHVNFGIRNPWSNRFQNVWSKCYSTPFKNKYIELEVYKDTSIISFSFNLTHRQDHAGLDTEIGFMGYGLRFNFYDNRHWNVDASQYYSKESDSNG